MIDEVTAGAGTDAAQEQGPVSAPGTPSETEAQHQSNQDPPPAAGAAGLTQAETAPNGVAVHEELAPAGPPAEAAAPQLEDYGPEPQTFEEMGLSPDVLKALQEMGFSAPMPVQRTAFRPTMAGRDLIVQSRTGSGKTAAFGIPFAEKLIDPAIDCRGGRVQAIVLCPTRELALQVATEVGRIAAGRNIQVVPVYGGAPMGRQVEALQAGGQVVAGTPGRVLDHLRRGTLSLGAVRILVLDEADEMLSMGFYEDIIDIIKRCPKDRQTLLFSATIPDDVERISLRHMRAPLKLSLSQDYVGVAEIKHTYYMVSGMGRPRDLLRVLEVERPESAIIFCNTREETALVAEYLRSQGLDAEAISSDLTQADRERVMGRTKSKQLHYLVATDIAARGIDISDLSHVINFTFPESAEVYVHRTGRTGRAGKTGVAVSLIGPRELGNFYYLKLTYKIRPEERTLPSEEEVQTLREGKYVDRLVKDLLRDPGPSWHSLLRRVLSMEEGQRILALLLERYLTAPTPRAQTAQAEGAGSERPPRERERPLRSAAPAQPRSEERGERGDRDRRGRRDRDREVFAESPGRRREREEREEARRRRDDGRPRRTAEEPAPAAPAAEDQRPPEPPAAAAAEGAEAPPGAEARGAAEGGAAAREEERKRRRRRSRRGRGEERADTARADDEPKSNGKDRSSESGARRAPVSSPDDVIHVDDGREFWEAWVDSRSGSAPAEAGAAEEAETAVTLPEAAEAAAAPAEEKSGEVRRSRRRGERNGGSTLVVGPGEQRVYLNLGRRDGVDENELVALLQERGLPTFTAEVRGNHTYLAVPEDQVDAVVAAFNGQMHKNRQLLCERARK